MAIQRWMKNMDTGVVFPWGEPAINKSHMYECAEDGSVLIENQPVADEDMVDLLERISDDKKDLKAENKELKKQVAEYKAAWGPLGSKLPDSPALKKQKAALKKSVDADKEPEVKKEAPVKEATAPKLTKGAVAKALLSEHGLTVDPKKKTLPELIKMKADLDKTAPAADLLK